jgi:hypothetical protein
MNFRSIAVLSGIGAMLVLSVGTVAEAQSGVKTIVNKSGQELTVTLLPRIGSEPSHSGSPVSQQVGSKPVTIKYGDDQNPYLNGMTLSWEDSGAVSDQSQTVTERSSAWDNTLNTNDAETISKVSSPDVKGSNSPIVLPSGSKILINKTSHNLTVTLQTRIGDQPSGHGPPVTVHLLANGRTTVRYGSEQNPFLNGLTLSWQLSGSAATQSSTVTKRGSSWDNTLNTDNTLTIGSVSALAVTGSN